MVHTPNDVRTSQGLEGAAAAAQPAAVTPEEARRGAMRQATALADEQPNVRLFLSTAAAGLKSGNIEALPVEVYEAVLRSSDPALYQKVLESRAEAMQEFFGNWAESIAENAKRDREASERYRQLKPFMDTATLAFNRGLIDKGCVQQLNRILSGRDAPEPQAAAQLGAGPTRDPGASVGPARRNEAGLVEPRRDTAGVSVRRS